MKWILLGGVREHSGCCHRCIRKVGAWETLQQPMRLAGAGWGHLSEKTSLINIDRVWDKSYSLPSSALMIVIFASHQKKLLNVGLKQRNYVDTQIMNFSSRIIA